MRGRSRARRRPSRPQGRRARPCRSPRPASGRPVRRHRPDDRVVHVGQRRGDVLERRRAPHHRLPLLQLLERHPVPLPRIDRDELSHSRLAEVQVPEQPRRGRAMWPPPLADRLQLERRRPRVEAERSAGRLLDIWLEYVLLPGIAFTVKSSAATSDGSASASIASTTPALTPTERARKPREVMEPPPFRWASPGHPNFAPDVKPRPAETSCGQCKEGGIERPPALPGACGLGV